MESELAIGDSASKMQIAERVSGYYTRCLNEHGPTPRGVDWNGRESQILRFTQLCSILPQGPISVNDLGCGYGALFDYLCEVRPSNGVGVEVDYRGYDVSPAMIDAAKAITRPEGAQFNIGDTPLLEADFGIASGIFSVRVEMDDDAWLAHILRCIETLNRTSKRGFAFNCLTKYSDPHKMRPHLYYADPGFLFDWCMKNCSRHVALHHDYGLYEFTVLVRKEV